MEITNSEAIKKIEFLLEDVENIPIDRFEARALQMAIIALRIVGLIEETFKEDNDLMLDLDDWKDIKESMRKEGDPDAN